MTSKIHFLTIFFFLLNTSPVTSQTETSKTSRYNSLLWEITGHGLTKPSYLYGTMHVSQKVAFHLTDTFFMAINKCNVIALEEDPGTWMEDMMNSGYLSEMRGNFLGNSYGNFYKTAFQIELPANKDYSQSLSFQPALVNGLLYRFYSTEGNFEENTYLDLFIYQSAKKIGKPVVGLESFSVGQEYLIKSSMPDSEKTRYDNYNYSNRGDIREQIESAYRKGDLDLLDSLSRISSRSKNRQKYLVDERNKIFVSQMDSIMQTSTTLFTGVGAAHLPGENGVITLLRNKGYSVRAVAFHQSKKADKEKQKIENTFGPITYSLQYFPDSSVSLLTPGKFHRLIGGANSLFVYPDMTNGAYYSIFAMNRFEAFTGENIQYSTQRIDSLLYENIPGKILSKKYIKTPEGFPAIDITARNRRGDASRYRIIIAPEYIYFFNVSGTGDYVLDNQHTKYFNSIHLSGNSSVNDWKRIYGDEGGYSFEMPGNIFSDVKDGGGKINTSGAFIHSFNPADSSFYLFIRSEYPDYNYLEEDSFELSQLADEFADQFDLTIDSKEISISKPFDNAQGKPYDKAQGKPLKHPSLNATLHNEKTKYFIRIVINGSHYNLLCCKPGLKDQHEKFLASFQLEPMQYSKTFEEVIDTSMRFKVKTFPEKKTLASIASQLDYSERYLDNDNESGYSSDKVKNRVFSSPLTNDYIFVTYRKFNPFYHSKKRDEFWKYQVINLNNDSSMLVVGKKNFQKDSMDIMDFMFTDTACSRGIKFKMILKKDALYTLCTTVDTLSSPDKWITTFFDSFTPNDTATGESIFTPKSKKFFDHLLSSDTAKNKIARKNFWNTSLDSTAVPQLITWMNSSASKNSSSSFRENVISRIGFLNHDKSIPFLKDLYSKSEDSSNIQMAILSSLAGRQTLDGSLAFQELILKEAPLSNENYHISAMFSQFYDSLELAAKLYPGLLQLSSYPEYKEEVYKLLAAIVTNKKIKAEAYKSFLPIILHDANDELKRQFNADENNSKDDDNDYSSNYYNNFGRSGNKYNSRNRNYNYNAESFLIPSGAYNYDPIDKLYKHNSVTEDFAILLVSFYTTENGVRNFFTKLQKSKNVDLVLKSYVLMLQDSISTPDSIWTNYSASKDLRTKLYTELKKSNRLDKFDSTYKNQLNISESIIFKNLNLDKDSLQFLEKRFVKFKNDSGYVYIYKFKREKMDKWMIGYNYFQPSDIAKVDVESSIESEIIKDDAKLQKQVDKFCKRLALIGRQRAGNDYSYDELDEDSY